MKRHFGPMLRSAALFLAFVPIGACARPAAQGDTTGGTDGARSTGVSLQRFVAGHEKKLLAGDTNADGKVSKAEFLAAAKPGKADPARRFAKLDTNGDGSLDRSEIDAMLTRRFKRLDTNGDGVVSAEERAAGHAGKGKVARADAQP
ncbi:EF-hand domain-containing protein [Sphingomonas sp. PAMC 26605]|uniref:EF-hand domain-containing protein n=1 Tax=Sphingomonas sp. PAMC 26605 TaxID=1112214 RepID=UPI00026CDDE7|nr:EF-hand domain-containing protein [Sphingomonas sp. PAMC 26605]